MKTLTEQDILDNWNELLSIVEANFDGDRKEKILNMLNYFSESQRMMLCPASYKEHYHNAFPGGYVEHILNVYNISMDLYELWNKYSNFVNYTKEEVIFVALFHDLGKIGDESNEFYMPQGNEWRRNNLGELYTINEKLVNMQTADRSLYLLQAFDIKLTQNEWISIKIHDGLYDEANTSYLKVMTDNNQLKSSLPHLIHHSDMMACRIEYEEWKNLYQIDSSPKKSNTSKKYTRKKNLTETLSEKLPSNFLSSDDSDFSLDSLFDDGKGNK